VIGAARNRFKRYPEVPDEEAWYVPPYWRKSGSKRGKGYHLVPIVSWGAKAVSELDKLNDFEGSSGWLFPAPRAIAFASTVAAGAFLSARFVARSIERVTELARRSACRVSSSGPFDHQLAWRNIGKMDGDEPTWTSAMISKPYR